MEAEEAVGFFVGLQDKTEIAGGGGAGWQVDGDRMGRGIGCLGTGIEKGIKGGVEEGVASGGLVVELLPGGGGELVLALDGEQDLLLAVELEVVLEIGKGGLSRRGWCARRRRAQRRWQGNGDHDSGE